MWFFISSAERERIPKGLSGPQISPRPRMPDDPSGILQDRNPSHYNHEETQVLTFFLKKSRMAPLASPGRVPQDPAGSHKNPTTVTVSKPNNPRPQLEEEEESPYWSVQEESRRMSTIRDASYRPGGGPLQLVGCHRRDGRTPAALVRDPVQRILGRVLAIAPQTTPVHPS